MHLGKLYCSIEQDALWMEYAAYDPAEINSVHFQILEKPAEYDRMIYLQDGYFWLDEALPSDWIDLIGDYLSHQYRPFSESNANGRYGHRDNFGTEGAVIGGVTGLMTGGLKGTAIGGLGGYVLGNILSE